MHMRVPTTSDLLHLRRITQLYSMLMAEKSIANVGDIVMNVDHIYAHYYAAHRGRVLFVDTPVEGIDDIDEPELVFVASFYIALCLWHPYKIDIFFPRFMERYYKHVPSKTYPPPIDLIDSIVRHIMETLGGGVVRAPLFTSEENKWQSTHHRRLIGWFIGFRYSSFIKPCQLASAFALIAYDSERSTKHAAVGPLDTLTYWSGTDRNERIIAQIIVTHFTHVCRTGDPSHIGHPHMSRVSQFQYYVIGLDSNQSSSTPSTPRDFTTASSSSSSDLSCVQRDHAIYVCTDVLSHNIGKCITSLVYRAHNPERPQQRYTIKRYIMVDNRLPEGMATFVREISTLLALRDYARFICIPLSFGFGEKHAYIYMNTHGTNIGEYVTRNRSHFNPHAMQSLFHDMAAALLVCDHHNIVHNDVKPDNFIVEDGRAKLIDFGLAMCHFSFIGATTDRVHAILYRAPELILGDDLHDASIDIWALACTMYELCTGAQLFGMKPSDELQLSEECSDNGDLSINGRKMQLSVILARLKHTLANDRKEREFLTSRSLWIECACDDKKKHQIVMNDTYRPIDWTGMCTTVAVAIENCLNLVPSRRLTAYKLTRSLTRRDSLF